MNYQSLSMLMQRASKKPWVMAGGTDLLGLMKDRIKGPRLPIPDILVNIKSIPGMDHITKEGERGLRIGAAVTIHDLETSELIKTKYHLLLQAARQVGTAQIRYMGTLGGNIDHVVSTFDTSTSCATKRGVKGVTP
jgi:CO/xanthine dehydrogenase FAD-binding subunit